MRPTCHRRLIIAVLAATATMPGTATAAHASIWTPTQSISVGRSTEPAPRAGIARDGTSALVWRSKSGRLMLATGDRRGRFSQPREIDRSGAEDWSVAARSNGGFLVAWEDRDGIRVAVRTRSGRRVVVRRAAKSNGDSINGLQVAADRRGGWVVAESQFRVVFDGIGTYFMRAMTLSAGGRLRGSVQELGPGQFGLDARPTQALAVDERGRAVLAFERTTIPAPQAGDSLNDGVVVTTRPHGGRFSAPSELPGDDAAEPRVAVGDQGRALIATTRIRAGGESGFFGDPVVASLSTAGTLGSTFGPRLGNRRRAFAPSAAYRNDGRSVLVFQQRTSSQPGDPEGSVHAVAMSSDGSPGTVQTLTRRAAVEPVVVSVSRGRTLTMWSGRRGLGASFAGSNGRFAKTAVPKGPPPRSAHSSSTNRDLRSAGRYAIFAWSRTQDGRVRVSVRRF